MDAKPAIEPVLLLVVLGKWPVQVCAPHDYSVEVPSRGSQSGLVLVCCCAQQDAHADVSLTCVRGLDSSSR